MPDEAAPTTPTPPSSPADLLTAALRLLPCDAAALLKLDGHTLRPLAVKGLTEEAMSRRFPLAGHPRLAALMRSDGFHRFPADCGWPDPYDGLVIAPGVGPDELLPVHDCMGAPLLLAGKPWGVITFDALAYGTFDAVSERQQAAVLALLQDGMATLEQLDTPSGEHPTHPWPAAPLLRPAHTLEGQSPAMQQLIREVDTVAASDLTVLILGETGVGKELVAQRLHDGSRRSGRPLVQVNCAALPETLADTELFGHRRGAFTGATQDRTGKFELATGGTLLLDEVGELPLAVQAKLLRVLQSGEIQRPGSDQPLRVNVRILAATNRDLRAEVAAGRFRADLYHRLAVYPVHVPPLRSRGRDILVLAGAFLEENQQRLGARNLRLSPAARERLLQHDWPGNVRELEHLISRAALRAWADQRKGHRWIAIAPAHLGLQDSAQGPAAKTLQISTPALGATLDPTADGRAAPSPDTTPATAMSLREATEHFQRQWLHELLARHPHSTAAAARAAGMDRSNFHRLLKKLGLLPS